LAKFNGFLFGWDDNIDKNNGDEDNVEKCNITDIEELIMMAITMTIILMKIMVIWMIFSAYGAVTDYQLN